MTVIIIVTYFSFGYWIYLAEQLKKKMHNKGSMENIDICLLWFVFGLPKYRSSDISINIFMMIDVDRII